MPEVRRDGEPINKPRLELTEDDETRLSDRTLEPLEHEQQLRPLGSEWEDEAVRQTRLGSPEHTAAGRCDELAPIIRFWSDDRSKSPASCLAYVALMQSPKASARRGGGNEQRSDQLAAGVWAQRPRSGQGFDVGADHVTEDHDLS